MGCVPGFSQPGRIPHLNKLSRFSAAVDAIAHVVIEDAVFDQDVLAGFGIAAVRVGAEALAGHAAHRDVPAQHRVDQPERRVANGDALDQDVFAALVQYPTSNGEIRDYQQIASDLAAKARDLKSSDAPASRAMYAARAALDRQFDSVFGELPELQANRKMYRRLRQLEESRAILNGNFRAPTFARYLRSARVGQGRIQGSEPIDRMSALMQYISSNVPNSGTPTGLAIPDFMAAPLYQKAIMAGGNKMSSAYLGNPGYITGPGALGYLPEAMGQSIPFGTMRSTPAEAITGLLQRGGRAQGMEAAQGEGLLGGWL